MYVAKFNKDTYRALLDIIPRTPHGYLLDGPSHGS